MDSLAEAVKLDPVELRLKNIPTFSQGREGNPPYTTTGLGAVHQRRRGSLRVEGGEAARGRVRPRTATISRGVGMASCLWFAGGGNPPSTAIVKFFSDGSVNLNLGMSDIGTGTKTVMAMVVCRGTGRSARSSSR